MNILSSNKKIRFFLLLLVLTTNQGCEKFVDIPAPPVDISKEAIFGNDQTAISVLNGFYATHRSVEMAEYGGLLSDEFVYWPGGDEHKFFYYTNNVSNGYTRNSGNSVPVWEWYWRGIYDLNMVLESVNEGSPLSPNVIKQLRGEAYFNRAFNYFYLAGLYGELPLVVSSDYKVNMFLPRSPMSAVYDLMLSDLLEAQQLLSPSYVNGLLVPYTTGTVHRVRPTTWAASAFLARLYMFRGEYDKAEAEATRVINNTALYSLVSLDNVFLKNSQEAIFQYQPTGAGENTMDGMRFHLNDAPQGFNFDKDTYLSDFILNAFEPGDERANKWVGNYNDGTTNYKFPLKYKIGAITPFVTSVDAITEFTMVFRLAEQYLIRAEARARQDNRAGAIADLDKIRQRAGLPLIANTNPGISQTALIDAIIHERQVELFTEWGHRWFDLKRTGKVNSVMGVVTPAKGGIWKPEYQLLPLPYTDVLYGRNLTQNPGY